jgi:hypothetical protein
VHDEGCYCAPQEYEGSEEAISDSHLLAKDGSGNHPVGFDAQNVIASGQRRSLGCAIRFDAIKQFLAAFSAELMVPKDTVRVRRALRR